MMRKLVSLLAIILMACPVVALGVTYTDSFDNANPDLNWTFQDETSGTQPNAGTELWSSTSGVPAVNSPNYTVGFGGTLNLDATNIPPQSVFGLVSDSSFDPIPYVGSVTVSGILNADASATATNDHALLGFMNDIDGGGQDGYLMFISPTWHYVALYSIHDAGSINQTVLRLDIAEPHGLGHLPGPGDPLMDQPIDCTMQIETISPGGNIRISGSAYGDLGGGVQELVELSYTVGVDPLGGSGHDPSGSYTPADVPKIYAGAVGVVGAVTIDVPTPLNIAVDDFAAWSSMPGDFDLDGDVDVSDLGILATNYGTTTGATVFLGDADFNGTVDVSDLGKLATNYGTNVWAAAGAAVPEPGTLTLLVLGALALLIRRRR